MNPIFKSRKVIPGLTPSIKQCIQAVKLGKPLPGGVSLRENPQFLADKGVFDYRNDDPFMQTELARQRKEELSEAIAQQEKRSRAVQNAAKQEKKSETEQVAASKPKNEQASQPAKQVEEKKE